MILKQIMEYSNYEDWWQDNRNAMKEILITRYGNEHESFIDEVINSVQYCVYVSKSSSNAARTALLQSRRQQAQIELIGQLVGSENYGTNKDLINSFFPDREAFTKPGVCEDDRSILVFLDNIDGKQQDEVDRINETKEAIIAKIAGTDQK